MTIKTDWLDWLEASAGRLQRRYRQGWARLPRNRARPADPAEPLGRPGKPWSAIVAHVERDPGEVVVHLDLPDPHTIEADVRVIDSTLAISVLRRGSGIGQARLEDCYRRAIPLPSEVDPGSTVHKVDGDELVIRMQPKRATPQKRSRRSGTTAQVSKLPVGGARRDPPASGRSET